MSGGKPGRHRADVLLVERGLVESRARAQAVILAGLVFSGERRVEKAGDLMPEDAPLELRGQDHPWVSRGGLKLAHGLAHFGLSPAGRVCLDVGASTGGFTDVLLANGAAKVYAVDVGHGQLAWKLRQDPRVRVLERTNARHLTRAEVPEPVGAIRPRRDQFAQRPGDAVAARLAEGGDDTVARHGIGHVDMALRRRHRAVAAAPQPLDRALDLTHGGRRREIRDCLPGRGSDSA